MKARKTKKMTLIYWRSLSEASKRRALTYVFPLQESLVDWMAKEAKPNPKNDPWWKTVWSNVRIPEPGSNWKTVLHNSTYLM